MKRLRNEFFKHLHYLCLAGVIALGLMTIVATTGNDSELTPEELGEIVLQILGACDPAAAQCGGQGNTIGFGGSFIVTGQRNNGMGDLDLTVTRYNDNGTIDTTYATNGTFTFDGGVMGIDQAFSHALDATGRVVVTGRSANAMGGTDMITIRLTTMGMLDPTFNPAGPVPGVLRITGTAGNPLSLDQGNGIAIDAMTGNIFVTG